MGYLDGDTITVDAVLTKQGRKILADPNNTAGLRPVSFVLTDTGVDYNLWNPDHPSGSAFYGEAIENLPQPEALPQAEYFLRDQLVTLNKTITALPTIDLGGVANPFTFLSNNTNQPPVSITPRTLNYGNNIGVSSAEGSYMILIPDVSILTAIGGNQIDMSGVALQFINVQEVPQAALFEFPGGMPIQVTAAATNEQRTIQTTIIGGETGAYMNQDFTIPANIVDENVVRVPSGT